MIYILLVSLKLETYLIFHKWKSEDNEYGYLENVFNELKSF